jgi:hypothetical protein
MYTVAIDSLSRLVRDSTMLLPTTRAVFVAAGTFVGAALVPRAAAQRAGAPVAIRGVAFDSVRDRPLRDATIIVVGGGTHTTTDSRGRFHFDSVLPGSYTFALQHAVLDSLGFSGLSTRAAITDGHDEIRIAVPSFPTLWRAACPGKPPKDSGFVFGTIRDASVRKPVADATVEATWTDLLVDRKRHVIQRRWRMETRTDATGGYALCGLPGSVGLRLRALVDSARASGAIDLWIQDTRVGRRDLLIGSAVVAGDSSGRGTISGTLTDPAGDPFGNARILMDEAPEVRSGMDGRFTIPDVPSGTRQLEVRGVGMMPLVTTVDVVDRETAVLALNLTRLTTLAATRVTAATATRRFAADFDARRKSGTAYTMDSSTIKKYDRFASVFYEIPSLRAQERGSEFSLSLPDGKGGRCAPEVRIDGAEAAFGHLADLFTHEVAALEVYPRGMGIPMEFLRPGIQPVCGMVLVWTKYGFRNR